MDMNGKSNICIIGGGWSAASTVYHLIEGILSNKNDYPPLDILIIEKTENLWMGVPYGNLAKKDFFLIETLNQAGFPLFESWILKNRSRIATLLPEDNEVIEHWYKRNMEKILQGDIVDIYFPRHIFGIFIRELLNTRIAMAKSAIRIVIKKEEAIDIHRTDDGYEISTDKANYFSEQLILAIGSLPKNKDIYIKNYFSDNILCACFDYQAIFDAIAGSANKSLTIIGASASALELLYSISSNYSLMQKISVVNVISNSGRLIDGYAAPDYSVEESPGYVLSRRSSDVYRYTVEKLKNKIIITKGNVTAVNNSSNAIVVQYSKTTVSQKQSFFELISDVVVNCTGSSSVDHTSSVLIKNLNKKLPITEERRGFNVSNHNEVIGFPGLFINGPLLNRNFAKRQVENIPSVFRESNIIANKLLMYFRNYAEIE